MAEKTFDFDESLPPLPLPELEDTLKLYLETLRPHLVPEDLEQSRKLVQEFQENEGKKLQKLLLQRSQQKKNWLADWWLKYAYLRHRQPLSWGSNFGGIYLGVNSPLKKVFLEETSENSSVRAKTMSLFLHQVLRFWLMLRNEAVPPQKDGRGQPMTMSQFPYLFNTARVPRREEDQVECHFRTLSQGGVCPNHIIFIYHGSFYQCTPFDAQTGNIWSEHQLEQVILKIENNAGEQKDCIGTLTGGHRDFWADACAKLKAVSDKNCANLEAINSSILIAILDDSQPTNDDEMLMRLLVGNQHDLWMDKTTFMTTKNGLFGSQSEHSPFDGMVPVAMTSFVLTELYKRKPTEQENKTEEAPLDAVQELYFDMTPELSDMVAQAQQELAKRAQSAWGHLLTYSKYGKNEIKAMKIHPDTFFQVALQIAAFKTHKRALSTYETATTRGHYHGRTETVRSCTAESLELAKAVLDGQSSAEELGQLLRKAVDRHNQLMELGKVNSGCDRHLFGLQMLARELGWKEPLIFSDPAFAKSGGNGNFELSTSLCGYTEVSGACAPMVPHGYGVFYSVCSSKILVWIVVFKDHPDTDAQELWANLQYAFDRLLEFAH